MSIGTPPLLTRRSLLRVGALSPLIIPGRAVARVGGAPVVTSPCGSPIPLPSNGTINAPGCYTVTADDPPTGGNGINIFSSDVTVLGNNHSIASLLAGFGTNNFTNIVVQDLVVLNPSSPSDLTIQVAGTTTTAQTATPAVTLRRVTSNNTGTPLPSQIIGSNVLIDSCTFNGTSGAHTSSTDDPLLLYGSSDGLTPASWVTITNCFFGTNFDVGFEGLGSWNHVTVTNCIANLGAFGGIGAWYRQVGQNDYSFWMTNCLFQGNTVNNFTFPGPPMAAPGGTGPGSVAQVTSDAAANANWGGSTGNVWSGNTYTALNREQCEASLAEYRRLRRLDPSRPREWQEQFVCP